MALAFLLFTFLATSGGIPLSSNSLPQTNIETDKYSSTYIFGRELPECLKLGHYRTTSQIVWSCLATIFACTWVTIHPNLPGPRDTGFQRFWRRVTMAILAIIAPELITFFATRQWIAAKDIKRIFNERFDGGDDPEPSLLETVRSWFTSPFYATKEWFTGSSVEVRRKWTLTHGFFVQMGGFVMCRNGEPVQILTFDRLLAAIKRKEIDIPYIPEEEIMDKRKGDALTKLVVVLQTTWFVAQCLGRWMSHLPVTELEVSTLAFAVLNAYIYALWWSKPQDVLVPVKLEFKASASFPLPLNGNSTLYGQSPSNDLSGPPGESSSTSTRNLAPIAESTSSLTVHEDNQREKSAQPVIHVEFDKVSFYWMRHEFQDRRRRGSESVLNRIYNWFYMLSIPFCIIVLYPFRVAGKTMGWSDSMTASRNSGTKLRVGRFRVPMFYADIRSTKPAIADGLSIYLIPLMFGGIHLTLWSTSFPTPLEQVMWKVSAIYITAAPLLSTTVVILARCLKSANIPRKVAVGALWFTMFLYPIAHGVLIIISLVMLSHLPEGAYHEVQWANLLPHV